MEKITNNIAFMNEMFEKLNIRKDALEYFTKVEEKIMADPNLNEIISNSAYECMTAENINFGKCMAVIDENAEKFGEHPYTMYFLIALRCLPYLRELYEKREDLTEEMFWDGADDLRSKLEECLEMHGMYGTFVASWFCGFLNMSRIALGRFQYIIKHYENDTVVTPCGHLIEKGGYIVEFHIPSSGAPLTDEVRNDSYRKAWEYFSKITKSNRVVLRCTTWLLYPEHYRFLPPNSNILKFMDDFDLTFYSQFTEFKNKWRLFGKSSEKPLEEWDEKTSLQRAYKKRLLEGKPVGDAMGFIIMENGVNVTKKVKPQMYRQKKIYNNIPFMNEMFEKLNISKDALEYFTKVEEQIMADPELNRIISTAAHDHMMSLDKGYGYYMELMEKVAEEYGLHEYTLKFILTLRCMPYLREQYKQTKGYTEEMFWQGADDMRCKLEECIECKGIYGSFVAGWFGNMLDMKRVALGRFQYILKQQNETITTESGHVIEKGSYFAEFHIPSSGVPLTDEVRNDSYRKAWEFYKDIIGSNRVVLRCSSWLLYKEHYNFLPKHSNLLKFMDDFDLQETYEFTEFEDDWRLFGKSTEKPLEEWDEKTSLQRAYKKRLLEGKPVGESKGFIIMEDGVNVTKKGIK